MFGEIGVGPGIGLPVGIGEVVYLYAYVLLNEVDAGLQIRENALGVFLWCFLLDMQDAPGICLLVGVVGVGAELHQPGLGHLSAHLPGEKVGLGVHGPADDHSDGGLGLKFLKQGIGNLVVAGITVVKGEHDRLLRQGLSRCQLPG